MTPKDSALPYNIENEMSESWDLDLGHFSTEPDTGRKWRLLFVVNGTEVGGTEVALLQACDRLRRKGHTIHVVSLKSKGPVAHRMTLSGVAVSSLEMSASAKLPDVALAILKLTNQLRKEPYDLIHSFMPRSNVISRVANRLSGSRRPHVSSEESTDHHRSRLVSLANRVTAGWSEQVLAVSRGVRETLINRDRIPPAKVLVLENAVDVHRFDAAPSGNLRSELGLKKTDFIFCTVGRLVPVKGHVYLVRALSQMRNRTGGIHVVIAGCGPEESEIREEVARQGLSGQVHLLGLREDIEAIFKASDAFILPSLQEGIPMALLEAMACALPVIATNVGGIAEVLVEGHAGLLVKPSRPWGKGSQDSAAGESSTNSPRTSGQESSSTASLSEAMDRVCSDEDLRLDMGVKARQRVAGRYSLDSRIERLERLYRRLLKDTGLRDPSIKVDSASSGS